MPRPAQAKLRPEPRPCCHDIAKTWTILHGGAHDQLGAAIVREETGNPLLAQAVLYHVQWPWEEGPLAPENEPLRLPLLVAYADKRVRHDRLVSLEERFDDLLNRYGDNEEHRASIRLNRKRSLLHEAALLDRLRLKNDLPVRGIAPRPNPEDIAMKILLVAGGWSRNGKSRSSARGPFKKP